MRSSRCSLSPADTAVRWTTVLWWVSGTFLRKGQAGQQLLLGALFSIGAGETKGTVNLHPYEMEDVVLIDG